MIEILIGLLVIIVGWSLNRTLGKVDESLKTLNKTVRALELNMENKPDFDQVKMMAHEAAIDAVKDHVIEKHGA